MSEDNTYVFDPLSAPEMVRLTEQDRMTTQVMGGPLAGLPRLPVGKNVLDIACGPGGWVLDLAFERPDLEVAGVDISRPMIDYANARARTQHLTNASFGLMNITEPLDFPDASFSFVNARYLGAALKREAWVPFLAECLRILEPGGLLRLTEQDTFATTSSVAVEEMSARGYLALQQLGYGFSVDGRTLGLLPRLPSLLRQAGIIDIHCSAYAVELSANTPHWMQYYHNCEVLYVQSKTFQCHYGSITPEDYDILAQRALADIQQPDFTALQQFVSFWGYKKA